MQVEFVGSSRRDSDNEQAQTTRLVNMYRENIGGKVVLKAVPGSEAFSTVPGILMRSMIENKSRIYSISGGRMFEILQDGSFNDLGEIKSDAMTSMATNNGAVVAAAGGNYYVFDETLERVVLDASESGNAPFEDVGSVTFSGQKTVITEKGGRRIAWSDVIDPKTFDPLNFATAEQRDDAILRAEAISGEVWLFKEDSIERWYDQGLTLAYRVGSLIEFGLKSFGLFTSVPNGGFFVGSDNVVYLISGGQMRPVSDRAVETLIAEETPARCFYYEIEGHKMCVLAFDDRPAQVYDVSMNEWHERSEGEALGPWTAVDSVRAFGKYYIGTHFGEVQLVKQNNRDVSGPLVRRAISGNLRNAGELFNISSFEVWPRVGFSQLSQPGGRAGSPKLRMTGAGQKMVMRDDLEPPRDAVISLSVSRDRGITFGAPRNRSLGDLGDYQKSVRWRALGRQKNICVQLLMSDETEITIEAVAEATVA